MGTALSLVRNLDRFRGLAAALLIALLVLAALAPLGDRAPNPAAVSGPAFDGQPPATLADGLFNYPADTQRQPPEPPGFATTLHETGLTSRLLRACAADMLLESNDASPPVQPQPSPARPVRDAIMAGGPDRWNALEEPFTKASDGWGANGLGVIESLRAAASLGAERNGHQIRALTWFNVATESNPESAPYRFNWALLHLSLGHYGQAAAGLDLLRPQAAGHPEVSYYLGLALLRLGDPQAALDRWSPLTGGSGRSNWRAAALEGAAAAQAALGHGTAATAGYAALLHNPNNFDWDVYDSYLRLQLAQGGPARTLAAVRDVAGRFPTEQARFRYDEGRLLLLLGQPGPAVSALRAAVRLGAPDDALGHVGLAQALLAAGDSAGARTEAAAAIVATGGDPTHADLTLAYDKLTNEDPYQRAVGQAVLTANVVRAQALAVRGDAAGVRALAGGISPTGDQSAERAAWLGYYAGLVLAAGGQPDLALARIKPTDPPATTAAGPSRGARLLAWAQLLTPAQAHDQATTLVDAAGGKAGVPTLPGDAAEAAAAATLAAKLDAGGFGAQAAPFYRVAAAWEAVASGGPGTSPIAPDGTVRPVAYRLAEADFLRRTNPATAGWRYAQVLTVAPNLTDAQTNRAVLFSQTGNAEQAEQAFAAAAAIDPTNPYAAHNAAVGTLYTGNPLDFFSAATYLSTARQTIGPTALHWGTAPVAAPVLGAPVDREPNFTVRIPAIATLLLLLLHTVIPTRNGSASTDDTDSVPWWWRRIGGQQLPAGKGTRYWLVLAVLGAGFTWAAALYGLKIWSFPTVRVGVLLGAMLVTLLTALLAIGAQEGGHRLALRGEHQSGQITSRILLPGLLMAAIGTLFGVFYGWFVRTEAGAHVADDPATLPAGAAARTAQTGTVASRKTHPADDTPAALPATEDRLFWRGWGAMGPAARVALAGLLANVLLAVAFAVAYGFTGSPLWRIGLLGNLAVLAFTGTSERAADGWALWRRSPLLWLLLFFAAAAALTSLLLGAW